MCLCDCAGGNCCLGSVAAEHGWLLGHSDKGDTGSAGPWLSWECAMFCLTWVPLDLQDWDRFGESGLENPGVTGAAQGGCTGRGGSSSLTCCYLRCGNGSYCWLFPTLYSTGLPIPSTENTLPSQEEL